MRNIIVITGGPGAGKTHLAILLAEGYRTRAEAGTIIDVTNLPRNDKEKSDFRDYVEKVSGHVLITMIEEYDPATFPVQADRVIEVRKG